MRDIRRFMYECRDAVFAIRSLERQRDAVRIPIGPNGKTTMTIGREGGTDNNPTATALNTYDYYDELLRLKIQEQKSKLMFFESVVGMLRDENEITVLRYYFAQGWTNAKIAAELDIDERTAGEKRRNALKKLVRKF